MKTLAKPTVDFAPAFNMFDRLFENIWNPGMNLVGPMQNETWLPVDVFEKDNIYHVRAAVPGLNPKDVEVTFDHGVLRIRGEFKNEFETDEKAKVYRREYRYGMFERVMRLPEDVNYDEIKAEFADGLLTVKVPKMKFPKVEPKKIEIVRK